MSSPTDSMGLEEVGFRPPPGAMHSWLTVKILQVTISLMEELCGHSREERPGSSM